MSLVKSPKEAMPLVSTGFEPEFWVNHLPRWELLEQNSTVRLTLAAALRKLLYVRYTVLIPRSSLRPMAATLIMIADMMDQLESR